MCYIHANTGFWASGGMTTIIVYMKKRLQNPHIEYPWSYESEFNSLRMKAKLTNQGKDTK